MLLISKAVNNDMRDVMFFKMEIIKRVHIPTVYCIHVVKSTVFNTIITLISMFLLHMRLG